jgi:hypothetical protein
MEGKAMKEFIVGVVMGITFISTGITIIYYQTHPQ